MEIPAGPTATVILLAMLAAPAWAEQPGPEDEIKFSTSQCRVLRQMGVDTRQHCHTKTYLFVTTTTAPKTTRVAPQQSASIEGTNDASTGSDRGDSGGGVSGSSPADGASGGGSSGGGSSGGGGGGGGSSGGGSPPSSGSGARPGGPDLIPEPPPPKPPPVTAITPPGKPLVDWWELLRPPAKPAPPVQVPPGKPLPDFGKPGRPGFDGKPDGDHKLLRAIIRDRLKDRIRDRIRDRLGGGGAQPRGNSRWGGSHR